jgi:hypothetical protein
MRERASLDEAIRKVESETATESAPHARSVDAPTPTPGEGNSRGRVFEQGAVTNGPPRGQITFREGQRPVIEFGQTADASTFINLFGHLLLGELMRDAQHAQAPDSLPQDARTVLHWLGVVKPDAIENKHHVQFARAFERYVMEGHAPSGALAPSLAMLSESLTGSYGDTAAVQCRA